MDPGFTTQLSWILKMYHFYSLFVFLNVNLFQPLAVMDLEGFVGHAVWELDSTNVMRHETLYDCCPAPFVDITYDIKIRKKQGSGWKFGK